MPGPIPNIINDAGPNELLRRRWQVDESAPCPSVAFELQPTLAINDYSADDDYMRGWKRCGAGVQSAAVAANYSGVRLNNPANSGMIVVVDYFGFRAAGTETNLGILRAAGNLASVAVSCPLDTRWNFPTAVNQGTAAVVSVAAAGAIPATLKIFQQANGQDDQDLVPLGLVLAPNTSLDIWNTSVNISILANFRWRERQAFSSEL